MSIIIRLCYNWKKSAVAPTEGEQVFHDPHTGGGAGSPCTP